MVENEGCIASTVTTFRDGYPEATIKGLTVRLHRVALEEKLGRPIDAGMMALHTCGNRWCISGDHLYEGTHQDNMNDMKRSGRSKNCGSPRRVTPIQVVEIRKRLANGELGVALAAEFGVHKSQISRIKNGKSHS